MPLYLKNQVSSLTQQYTLELTMQAKYMSQFDEKCVKFFVSLVQS